MSVPAAASDLVEKIDSDQIKVLSRKRHTNKLKTGHLRGNKCRIIIRKAVTNAEQLAQSLVSEIQRSGFPNYFGEQRFGNAGTTDDLGFRLLRGERARRLSRDGLRFTLSAVQSRMFNAWLADRISDGLSREVLKGDVMQVTTSKGPFVVTDVATEQARYDSHETVLSGPIFGPKMKQPEEIPAEREQAILDRFDLPREAFSKFKKADSWHTPTDGYLAGRPCCPECRKRHRVFIHSTVGCLRDVPDAGIAENYVNIG